MGFKDTTSEGELVRLSLLEAASERGTMEKNPGYPQFTSAFSIHSLPLCDSRLGKMDVWSNPVNVKSYVLKLTLRA